MPVRKANAIWEGDLTGGKGKMKMPSGAYEGPYSFSSRFEEGTGTNPEELIGAAHAGCFSMKLSGDIASAGFQPRRVETTANVHLDKVDGGFKITRIVLNSEAEVPGISESQLREIGESSKKNCPISQALAVEKIELNLRLRQ